LYNRPKWPQYQGLRYLGTQSHPTNNNNNNNNRHIARMGKNSYSEFMGKMYTCKTKKKIDNVELDPREVVRIEVIKMARDHIR
jgi:hypothetical protein